MSAKDRKNINNKRNNIVELNLIIFVNTQNKGNAIILAALEEVINS